MLGFSSFYLPFTVLVVQALRMSEVEIKKAIKKVTCCWTTSKERPGLRGWFHNYPHEATQVDAKLPRRQSHEPPSRQRPSLIEQTNLGSYVMEGNSVTLLKVAPFIHENVFRRLVNISHTVFGNGCQSWFVLPKQCRDGCKTAAACYQYIRHYQMMHSVW